MATTRIFIHLRVPLKKQQQKPGKNTKNEEKIFFY